MRLHEMLKMITRHFFTFIHSFNNLLRSGQCFGSRYHSCEDSPLVNEVLKIFMFCLLICAMQYPQHQYLSGYKWGLGAGQRMSDLIEIIRSPYLFPTRIVPCELYDRWHRSSLTIFVSNSVYAPPPGTFAVGAYSNVHLLSDIYWVSRVINKLKINQ